MARNLDTRRFHADSGPPELFTRVREVFREPVELRTHGRHFQERVEGKDAPVWALQPFEPAKWDLMLAEARTDTGKFVTTTWRRRIDGSDWWLVVGYNDTVKTFYEGNPGKLAKGPQIVTEGEVWDLVRRTNAQLSRDAVTPPHRDI